MDINILLEEIKRWLGQITYTGFENATYNLYENGELLSKRCGSFGLKILEHQINQAINDMKAYKRGERSSLEVTKQLGILSFSIETMLLH